MALGFLALLSPLQFSSAEEPRIAGSVVVGENSFHSPYLGYYYAWPSDSEAFGWIFHPGLEWLCVAGRGEGGGFWAWDPAMGWLYFGSQWWDVREQTASWVYLSSAGQFLWYEPGTTAPAWFLSYDLSWWLTDTAAPSQLAVTALDLETFMDATRITWAEGNSLAVTRNEVRLGETLQISYSGTWSYTRETDFSCNALFIWTIDTIAVTSSKGTETGTPDYFANQLHRSQPKQLYVGFQYVISASGMSRYSLEYTDGQTAGPYDFEF
ncbi:MAG: hypothetical protein SFY80_11170 [Verrucomicrobiota bacterium]|nr:hypothetical protein [Verrucomicrobiota bacterium]